MKKPKVLMKAAGSVLCILHTSLSLMFITKTEELSIIFVSFYSTGDQTQGLVPVKQACIN